ncbi:MAG: FtsX-like permease family protein [Candidatus Cyclobacteriaceae bacterium M2_1C_046]
MIKTTLNLFIRQARKSPISFIINALSLSIGLTLAFLVIIWAANELSYDKHHPKAEQLYRVLENRFFDDGQIVTSSSTPGPMAPYLKSTFPDIKFSSRYTWTVEHLFTVGERKIYEEGVYVDSDFLQIFNIKFINGDKLTALDNNKKIIITKSLADKYFPDEGALGETILLDGKDLYTISGIIEDLPENTNLEFKFLLPFEIFWENNKPWLDKWGNNNIKTFITLHDNVSQIAIEEKIVNVVNEQAGTNYISLFLHPVTKWRLNSKFENGSEAGGRIENILIFIGIAILVLIIAIVNFINLSTANATKKIKEIGIKKAIGATRESLAYQILIESVITALIAMVMAYVFALLILPFFNSVMDVKLTLLSGGVFILISPVLLSILVGLIAGIYPAFYLTKDNPTDILRNKLTKGKEGIKFRQSLIVVQFTLAMILITSTIIIYQQIRYLINMNSGFDQKNLISIRMPNGMKGKHSTVKNELLNSDAIESVTGISHTPLEFNNQIWGIGWEGKDPGDRISFNYISTDHDFIKTYGVELIDGRNFNDALLSDSLNFIVNEKGAEVIGLYGDVIGMKARLWDGGQDGELIGVMKDFNFYSAKREIAPLIISLTSQYISFLVVRAKEGKLQQAIKDLEHQHSLYASAFPFNFTLMEDEWKKKYVDDEKEGDMIKYFSIMAVIISCMGLFGLSAYSAERRIKEIGIRKILGAPADHLAHILGKEFLILIVISTIIGAPVAYYFSSNWIENFAFKINMPLITFLIAAILMLIIAVLTVSYHILKVTNSNPLKVLKNE